LKPNAKCRFTQIRGASQGVVLNSNRGISGYFLKALENFAVIINYANKNLSANWNKIDGYGNKDSWRCGTGGKKEQAQTAAYV
jgi:hypothetical protein